MSNERTIRLNSLNSQIMLLLCSIQIDFTDCFVGFDSFLLWIVRKIKCISIKWLQLIFSEIILKTDGYRGANPVLSRLMEEVRNDKNTTVGSRYDRVHNRHNR